MNLEVRNGTFFYQKEKPVLRDINISCNAKEAVAVLGPNGCGKTSFLKCMLGLLPWEQGGTYLNGSKVEKNKKSQSGFWDIVGYVPQSINREQSTLGLALSVEEMVLLGIKKRGIFVQPGKKEKEKVRLCLEKMDISYLQGKMCSRISGGELQLVLIARALVSNPQILVLDEPETGLDLKNRLNILELLKYLKEEQNMQLIWNTHYPENTAELADHILLLKAPGESHFKSTAEILTEEELSWAFDVNLAVKQIDFLDENKQKRTRISMFPYRKM